MQKPNLGAHNSLILLLFFTFFFFNAGCKKDQLKPVVQQKENISKQELKAWISSYEKLFSNGLKPLLDKAVKTYYNGQMIVKVPLSSGGGDLYFSKTDHLEVQFIRKVSSEDTIKNPFNGYYEFINLNTFSYLKISYSNGIETGRVQSNSRSVNVSNQFSSTSQNYYEGSWFGALLYCISKYIIAIPRHNGGGWSCYGPGGGPDEVQNLPPPEDTGPTINWPAWFTLITPPNYNLPNGPSDPWVLLSGNVGYYDPNNSGPYIPPGWYFDPNSPQNPIISTNLDDYYTGDGYLEDDDNENVFDPNATPDPVELLPESITLHTGKVITISFGVTQSDGEGSRKVVSKRMIDALKQTLELASIYVDISSIHIAASTNGQHAATSNHYKGLALDISKINGVPIIISGANENVIRLQQAFEVVPNRRENYGPALSLKLGQPKPVSGHDNHIHFAINAQ